MTIIYSNAEDIDCHVLRYAFENLKDANLVEIDKSSIDWMEHVNDAISKENDFIMFLGHGDEGGLYSPNFDFYVLDKNNVGLINAKNVVCCWCNASLFVFNNKIKNCFSTSMFISNEKEAIDEGIHNASQAHITSLGKAFYQEMNNLITKKIKLSAWQIFFGCRMDVDDEIDKFNRQGLYYNDRD